MLDSVSPSACPPSTYPPSTFAPCALVPTYENPRTVEAVVVGLRMRGLEVVLVDDGSGANARRIVESLAALGGVHVLLQQENGGKGKAVLAGFRRARDLGFTHALTVDADGRHDLADVERFIEESRLHPEAMVLGVPLFDEGAPLGRVIGRKMSAFWCAVETGGKKIHDPLCGYRMYPLEASLRLGAMGTHMDFDPEITVRLSWAGVSAVNVETRERHLTTAQGGGSHFRVFRDNVRMSWMHTRLVCEALLRLIPSPRMLRGR